MIAQDFVSKTAIEHVMDALNLSHWEKEYVRLTVSLECYASTRDGVDGYMIDMVEPFIGLGQFSRSTWNGLERLGLLDFPYAAAGSVSADISAIVALAKDSKYSFQRNFPGKEFTQEVAYGYHNQGAPAFEAYLRGGAIAEPHQSDRALALLARVKEDFDA